MVRRAIRRAVCCCVLQGVACECLTCINVRIKLSQFPFHTFSSGFLSHSANGPAPRMSPKLFDHRNTHIEVGRAPMNPPTSFNAIPGQDDLAAVTRDLSFHPSTASGTLKALTADQIEQFNRDGYLKPFRIFTDAEIAELREYFDRLLARYTAEGKDSYSISSAHLRHGRVWDVLTNPRIVALVSDLLGPSVVAWGSHFFCKMPRDGKTVELASGRELLAAHALEGRHRVAGDRRCRSRQRGYEVHPRHARARRTSRTRSARPTRATCSTRPCPKSRNTASRCTSN